MILGDIIPMRGPDGNDYPAKVVSLPNEYDRPNPECEFIEGPFDGICVVKLHDGEDEEK
jgi:hypothetical protein